MTRAIRKREAATTSARSAAVNLTRKTALGSRECVRFSAPESTERIRRQRCFSDGSDGISGSVRRITAAAERTSGQRRVSGSPVREHLRHGDFARLDILVTPGKAAGARASQVRVDLLVHDAADVSVVQRKTRTRCARPGLVPTGRSF